ncbi:MAG: hypothetical protein JSS86_07735 [Cyanobacteria bacterium SZAS LIN-2]|nr:hypothetical protein [Cyanobacteria bacterium SZAS LIN-2]
MTALTDQSRAMDVVKQNRYVTELLTPTTTPAGGADNSQSARFNSLIAQRLSAPAASASATATTASASDVSAMAGILAEVEDSYRKGDTNTGIGRVNKGLIYFSATPGLPVSNKIDLLIGGAKISHKAKNFDKAREYVNEALDLSRAGGAYQMGAIEGLRLLLNGDETAVTTFNEKLMRYNDALEKNDVQQLPALADGLVDASRSLPEDSYFRLEANLSKAAALKLSGGSPASVKDWLSQTQGQAEKARDQAVVQQCRALLSAYTKNQ